MGSPTGLGANVPSEEGAGVLRSRFDGPNDGKLVAANAVPREVGEFVGFSLDGEKLGNGTVDC